MKTTTDSRYHGMATLIIVYVGMILVVSGIDGHFKRRKQQTIVSVLATPSSSDWNRIGPIQLLPSKLHRKSFCWTASVDLKRGLAYSNEISNVLPNTTNPYQRNDRYLSEMVIHLFESYPKWLCQGKVSLGLLYAKISLDQKRSSIGLTEIRTRWGNVNVLTFGQPQRRHICNRLMIPLSKQRFDSITLPILGGWMTSGVDQGNKGSLSFTMHTSDEQLHSRFIITEIDRYQPMLLGENGGTWRARMYLHTQSVIHAYVMWRFHNHVLHQMNTIVN
jgi:hypothetical protein